MSMQPLPTFSSAAAAVATPVVHIRDAKPDSDDHAAAPVSVQGGSLRHSHHQQRIGVGNLDGVDGTVDGVGSGDGEGHYSISSNGGRGGVEGLANGAPFRNNGAQHSSSSSILDSDNGDGGDRGPTGTTWDVSSALGGSVKRDNANRGGRGSDGDGDDDSASIVVRTTCLSRQLVRPLSPDGDSLWQATLARIQAEDDIVLWSEEAMMLGE